MTVFRPALTALLASALLVLAACGLLPVTDTVQRNRDGVPADSAGTAATAPSVSDKALDVVIFALGLVETGYRFGGKNPEAGLDCSGMVNYVFRQAASFRLQGSAVELAHQGRPVAPAQLRPGDLVFFNTLERPYSHVGIYIGEGRFVHAPSSRGKVRIDSLQQGWYASRFEAARTYFD